MILERLFSATHSTTNSDMPAEWLMAAMGGRKASSGQYVTAETTMSLASVFACVRNISEDVAKYPFKLFKDKDAGGREYLAKHRVNRLLLTEPNPEMTAMNFWETLVQWALWRGRGCAEIERNGRGDGVWMWPIHPSRLTLMRNQDSELVWKVSGDKRNPETNYVPDSDMFHLHGLGDGLTGYVLAQLLTDPLGRAMAAQAYASGIFGGGGTQRVALKHPMQLDEKSKQNIRSSWVQLHGNPENQVPAILDKGLDVSIIGIDPEKAQMLETMRFDVEVVARICRCPTSKIQHWLQAKGWSTLDAENKDYVFDTLTPWFKRAEQEADRKLLSNAEESLYTKHIIDFLLFATPQDRANYLSTRLKNGTLSINEWRELEDMDPIGEGGDAHWIEGNNMVPVEIAVNPPEPVAPALPAEQPPKEDDSPQLSAPEPDKLAPVREAALAALNYEFKRALRREIKSVQTAAKKLLSKGDHDGFETWTTNFYAEWACELSATIGPVAGVLCAIDGGFADTWSTGCAKHATTSKAHLLAVLRDEGPEGVTKRLNEWESTRSFEYANN